MPTSVMPATCRFASLTVTLGILATVLLAPQLLRAEESPAPLKLTPRQANIIAAQPSLPVVEQAPAAPMSEAPLPEVMPLRGPPPSSLAPVMAAGTAKNEPAEPVAATEPVKETAARRERTEGRSGRASSVKAGNPCAIFGPSNCAGN